ncbi:MAG: rane protein of unknown function [Candidatus Saccharibacteria bacterium]|nr:rane protein of unknown function [Candidatus Saccharibacteria bacterium]
MFLVASPIAAVALPQPVLAADSGNCEKSILGIPPWYRGLTQADSNGDCVIKSPDDSGGLSAFIWKIVLNGIQIALVIAGYVALFYIIYGGFLFITGGGNASQVEKARKSILNAVIGLVISIGAIAITNLIFGVFGSASTTNSLGVPELSADDLLRNGINLVYYIGGIVAVIVIIISGIMYSISMGDSGRVTRSKNMILYSLIGIVILIAAFAITNFVFERF